MRNHRGPRGQVFVRGVECAVSALCALILGFAFLPPAHADNLKPRVIVFVHGLHGSRDSWRAPNGAYWPDLIRTDPHFPYSDVVVAEYPTPCHSNGTIIHAQLAESSGRASADPRLGASRKSLHRPLPRRHPR